MMNEFDGLKFKEIAEMINEAWEAHPEEVEEMVFSKCSLDGLTRLVNPKVDEMSDGERECYEQYLDTVEELDDAWKCSEQNLLKYYRGEEL